MPNQITKDGITIRSLEEIKDLIINGDDETPGLQQIFGEDAVFESDSPDGQLVGIFAQAIRDLEELALQIYSSFDPDQAVGISLDNRVLYNGLRRKGGTYTIIPVTVVCGNIPTKIYGLDEVPIGDERLFTVMDNIGNEFYLISSRSLDANESISLSFRAKELGTVNVSPNSITRQRNINMNIKSVSNPNKAFIIGEDQETDEELRIRRSKAVGYGLMGSVEVLQNALRQLENVTDVAVFENNTDEDDTSDVAGGYFPAHFIWIIVEGGDPEKIAATIFLRLNLACGMKYISEINGGYSIPVETVEGNVEYINFCAPLYEPLLLKITATPKNSRAYLNPIAFKENLVKNTSFSIYSPASTTELDCTAKVIQGDYSYYDINVARKADALGVTTTSTIDYTQWTSITDGVLKINLNNGLSTLTYDNLDFSGVASVSDIVTVLSTAITDYVTITNGDNNEIIFNCTNYAPGTNSNPSGFVPIPDDSETGTDIFNLLGTIKQSYSVSAGDWKELIFPDTYQHKFTLSADDIDLTSLSWGNDDN
jgi:hypothetical protein